MRSEEQEEVRDYLAARIRVCLNSRNAVLENIVLAETDFILKHFQVLGIRLTNGKHKDFWTGTPVAHCEDLVEEGEN